jgi:hypothetical protein
VDDCKQVISSHRRRHATRRRLAARHPARRERHPLAPLPVEPAVARVALAEARARGEAREVRAVTGAVLPQGVVVQVVFESKRLETSFSLYRIKG